MVDILHILYLCTNFIEHDASKTAFIIDWPFCIDI